MDSNGDQMFSVTPSSGELPPVNFSGQLFIVAYKPRYYGKTHTSKLIIHVSTECTEKNFRRLKNCSTVVTHTYSKNLRMRT